MKQTRYHRGGAMLFGVATALGSCQNEAKEAAPPPEPSAPSALQEFAQPSDQGVNEVIAPEDSKVWSLGYLAGSTACSLLEIGAEIGDQQIHLKVTLVEGSPVSSVEQQDFAKAVEEVVDDYLRSSGDTSYEHGDKAFQAMFDKFNMGRDSYCEEK